jgi:hypothetical protein
MLVIKRNSTRGLASWNGVSVNGLELANAHEHGNPNSRVAVHHKSTFLLSARRAISLDLAPDAFFEVLPA